jgi:PAS domain S-box-containing protein
MKAFSRLPVWFRMPLASVLVLIALAVTVHFPLFGRIPWMLSMLAIGMACAIGETGAALVMAGIAAFGVNRLVLNHSITIARPTPLAQTIAFLVVASFVIHLVHLRNRALRTAEASESHYRSLTEAAADVVVSIDSNSRVLSVNPAVKTIFGYEPDELIGGQMTQLMPERLRALHKSGLARHLQTGERHMPWNGILITGLHKDGREIPLEVSFGSYRQNGKTFFTGFIRDISERQKVHSADGK